MNSIVTLLTSLADGFVSLLAFPFEALNPWVGLLVISIVSGILFLLAYGRLSPQQAIKNCKRKIFANLYEAVIFRHQFSTAFKAQGRLLGNALNYFLLAVPPILVLLIPCLLILAQLETRYGSRALLVGESSVVELQLANTELLNEVKVKASDGLQVTPAVRVLEKSKLAIRVDAKSAGKQELIIEAPNRKLELHKMVPVEVNSSKITGSSFTSWWQRLLYPSELNLLPYSNFISNFDMQLPSSNLSLLGWHLHWLIIFAVVSIITGVIGARFLKIEI